MSGSTQRVPLLQTFYRQYMTDEDTAAFLKLVTGSYTVGTLVRLVRHSDRLVRRGAVLALGFLADFADHAALGSALVDPDRGVRGLAENASRLVWCRDGSRESHRRLERIIRLNNRAMFEQAAKRASELLSEAPWFAEAWNQRAIAYFGMGRLDESVQDCRQALELNPYHFAAAAGMGRCYLRLGHQALALESFRRALHLYPDLEGVRAQVMALERRRQKD